jgi:hypothetical protein
MSKQSNRDRIALAAVEKQLAEKVARPSIGDTFTRDGKTETITFVGQYDDYGGFWRVRTKESGQKYVNFKG